MNAVDPCPFCGEEKALAVADNEMGYPHVYCESCFCEGPPAMDAETNDEAIAKWNNRAFTRSVLEKFVADTYAANQHIDPITGAIK